MSEMVNGSRYSWASMAFIERSNAALDVRTGDYEADPVMIEYHGEKHPLRLVSVDVENGMVKRFTGRLYVGHNEIDFDSGEIAAEFRFPIEQYPMVYT